MSEWTRRDQERFYDLILNRCNRRGLTSEEFEELEALHARRGDRIDFFPSSPDFIPAGARRGATMSEQESLKSGTSSKDMLAYIALKRIRRLEASLAEAKKDSQRLEKLKEELEGIVKCGSVTGDWGDGYEVACKDVLKKLEEPHECKKHAIPVEGRGWVCEKCGYHITGD